MPATEPATPVALRDAPRPTGMGPIRRVVLQPTSYCNIDCRYCYLPGRDERKRMTAEVVDGLLDVLVANRELVADELEFRWHAGEPLLAGLAFYHDACERISRRLQGVTRPRFSIQTNGTMVNDDWCDLFRAFDIEVGVSIDGPASIHDAHRMTRQGHGTFLRTMAGIDTLGRNGVGFDVIAVVTAETLNDRSGFLNFFEELRPRSLGFNPEETELAHRSGLFGADDYIVGYRAFLEEVLDFEQRTGIVVREFAGLRRRLTASSFRNEQAEPLSMLNVDADGGLSTFSPELLGLRNEGFDHFVFGNVSDRTIDLRRWTGGFARFADEVALGKELCRRSCGYFEVCGGGAPVNKLSEQGTVVATATEACRSSVMLVTDVVLDALERQG